MATDRTIEEDAEPTAEVESCGSSSTAVTAVYILGRVPQPTASAGSAAGVAVVNDGDFKVGEVVPGTRYRVRGLLGVGGMGSVYEVEHTELGKRFVLKALLSTLTLREDLVARLRNEQRALGRLEHPSIVNVTDAGVTTSNIPYFVMERLEGETLGARLKRTGCLAIGDALAIAAEVLDGLAAAHEIGVVHRDIKPQNIFLSRENRPKILDFGVAKMSDAGSSITARGVAVGTPRYMSPEQASGERVDGRSDLYAVGLLLFESLTGRGPFDEARDANELLLAHLSRPAPLLSSRVGSVTRDLDELVAALLAKHPSQRPASAREAAALLRRVALPYATSPAADPALAGRTVRLEPPAGAAPTTRADGVAARHAWGLREGHTEDAQTLARFSPAPATDTLIDGRGGRTWEDVAGSGDFSTLAEAAPLTRTEILTAVEQPFAAEVETHTSIPLTPTDGSRTLDPVPLSRLRKAPRSSRRGARLLAAGSLTAAGGVLVLTALLRRAPASPPVAAVAAGVAPEAPPAAPAATSAALPVLPARAVVAPPPDGPTEVAPISTEPSHEPAPVEAPARPVATSRSTGTPAAKPPRTSAPAARTVPNPRPPTSTARASTAPKVAARPQKAPSTPKVPDGLPGSGL